MKKHLSAGKVINKHGFRGTVKVESWCDSPQILAGLKTLYPDESAPPSRAWKVQKSAILGKFVLLTLQGVDSEEKADALRGAILYAAREDLPLASGAAFLADMIGLPVIDANSGVTYGTLKNIEEGVASRIYEIQTASGIVLMPEVPSFIDRIDTEKGVFVLPIPGMFDGTAEEIGANED